MESNLELGYRLNIEVRISGGLIWDSIEKLHKISRFPYVIFQNAEPKNIEDCYMCLYDAAQGIERLQKVLIELYARKINTDPEQDEILYNLLMSHNHKSLNDYIKINICSVDNKFNKLLSHLLEFYNEIRYNNFRASPSYDRSYFYNMICSYGENIRGRSKFTVEQLESFKYEFGKLLGGYALLLYDQIYDVSSDLNNFTYEYSGDSKAGMVFSLENNDNLYRKFLSTIKAKREIMYYIMTKMRKTPVTLEGFEPLDLDRAFIPLYCKEIIENEGFSCYEEINFQYDELYAKNKNLMIKRNTFSDFIFSDDYLKISNGKN